MALESIPYRVGKVGVPGVDGAFIMTPDEAARRSDPHAFQVLVGGDGVRDWSLRAAQSVFFPYDSAHTLRPLEEYPSQARSMWKLRTELGNRPTFARGTYFSDGRPWYEWHQLPKDVGASKLAITFAEVATHNHFVLERGEVILNQTAPVIKLRDDATEDDHYDLLGVLNSSSACFWLKQVSHNKGNGGINGGIADQAWERFFQFGATKLLKFPLPENRQRHLARQIDETARARADVAPMAVLRRQGPSALAAARDEWLRYGRELVALQEELDWRMYAAYGLVGSDLAPSDVELVEIEPTERAFEVRLARMVSEGSADGAWFARHARVPATDFPEHWSDDYRDLAVRRLHEIDENPAVRLLEQPEYKRRWSGEGWDALVAGSVEEVLLDRLEGPELWSDSSGRPQIRSVAQISDILRNDAEIRGLVSLLTRSLDFDLTTEIRKLLLGAAAPAFAPQRYRESGLEKFRSWQRTWDLQRDQDRGMKLEVPIPPKYAPTDFAKPIYWSLRGRLDVPGERFLSFPGSKLADDPTELFGWAGWDPSERGQAIARLANELSRTISQVDAVLPLIGALIELQPWLDQWYSDIDSRSGVSPASAVSGATTALLGRLGIGADTVLAWRPAPATRGRKKA